MACRVFHDALPRVLACPVKVTVVLLWTIDPVRLGVSPDEAAAPDSQERRVCALRVAV